MLWFHDAYMLFLNHSRQLKENETELTEKRAVLLNKDKFDIQVRALYQYLLIVYMILHMHVYMYVTCCYMYSCSCVALKWLTYLLTVI